MITTVFFDLDDTLFDFKRSERKALTNTLARLGIEPTEKTLSRYSDINRGQWEALERGEVTRDVILVRRYEILFSELGVNADPHSAQAIYEKELSGIYFYVDGAIELVEKLRATGKYRMYLASNGTAVVQDSRIAISGIAKYFDGVFISERIGYNKPSPKFFEGCFAQIEVFSKDEAIIIGDSLTSDIQGGINAGIRTCLFNPKRISVPRNIMPDYEVCSLDEIPDLLERI